MVKYHIDDTICMQFDLSFLKVHSNLSQLSSCIAAHCDNDGRKFNSTQNGVAILEQQSHTHRHTPAAHTHTLTHWL